MRRLLVIPSITLAAFGAGVFAHYGAVRMVNHETVATVAQSNITRQELVDALMGRYAAAELDSLTESLLLNEEAKRQNVRVGDEEVAKYASRMRIPLQLARTKLLVRKLADVNDQELDAYLTKEPMVEDGKIRMANIDIKDHVVGVHFIDDLPTLGLDEDLRKYGLTVHETAWIGSDDPMFDRIEGIKVNNATMIMEGAAHKIVVVLDKQEGRKLQLPSDRETVRAAYVEHEYGKVYADLINRLHAKYPVRIGKSIGSN